VTRAALRFDSLACELFGDQELADIGERYLRRDETARTAPARAADTPNIALPPVVRDVVDRYRADADVRGVVLVGSASRPYRDEQSDFDLEVIVGDDGYARLSESERWTVLPGGVGDVLVVPESDFARKKTSPADIDHFAYERCVVLHDPDGYVAREIRAIVQLPERTRERRITLHYFEFLFAAQRVRRARERGAELNARLVAASATAAAVKLRFLLDRRWPPVVHWTEENVAELDGDGRFRTLALDLLRDASPRSARAVVSAVDELLVRAGFDLPRRKNRVTAEVAGALFRDVRERYGAL
jgi:hypothetical protein